MKSNCEPVSNCLSEQSIDGTSSVNDKSNKSNGRWTKEEHQKFMEGLKLFGQNWQQVEEYIGTRSGAQIRSHAQKFFNRLQKQYGQKKSNGGKQSNQDPVGGDLSDSESEKENILSTNCKLIQNIAAAAAVAETSKQISSPIDPSLLLIDQELQLTAQKNLDIQQESFHQPKTILEQFDIINSQAPRPLLQEKFQQPFPQIENPILPQSRDSCGWVNPDSSYFNYFLSQISYSNLQQIQVPKLYEICGWGVSTNQNVEQSTNEYQQPTLTNESMPLQMISNQQILAPISQNNSNQHNNMEYDSAPMETSRKNSCMSNPGSRPAFQSFQICEEDAMKSLQLQNLRRKTSMDCSLNFNQKIQTDSNMVSNQNSANYENKENINNHINDAINQPNNYNNNI